MSTLTTLLNLIKPTGAENVDIAVINANMDTLDAKYGGARPVANAAARTALTPFQGQHVIEADTRLEYIYSGAAWVALAPTYYRSGATQSLGTIGASANGGLQLVNCTIVPTISGRYMWRNSGWLRNITAGSLTGIGFETFFGAIQGTTVANPSAPVGSMSCVSTGYVDLVAGTSYIVYARFSTGTGSGLWIMEAVVAEIFMGTLIP